MTKKLLLSLFAAGLASAQPTVIRTTTLIDGKGQVLRNKEIVVENGRITRITDPTKQKPTFDLSGLTVMPGWIDTHTHPIWYFNRLNRLEILGARDAVSTPQEAALYVAANLYATLMGGFTTIQSVGSAQDKAFRDMINSGAIPGPRLLTALNSISERTGTPEQIRAFVDKNKADGADLIKIFATASIRDGGKMTMTVEQIQAACDEANKVGLRTLVHAHATDGARAAVEAGCTSIEHGTFVDDATLQLIKDRGAFFDPNFLVLHNYTEANRPKFEGIGNYNAEGFAAMVKAIPDLPPLLRRARRMGLKVVLGTDAVAGSHGRNAEEFIYHVKDGGDKPMEALMSGTSVAAESLRMGDQIGAIAPGMQADIVATVGNPLDDITAVRRVAFVMKGGKVYKETGGK